MEIKGRKALSPAYPKDIKRHYANKSALCNLHKKCIDVAYQKIVKTIPVEKREKLSNKLIDLLLKSKNDDKMPSDLANTILHHWQLGPLTTEAGLAALLEAAVLLESEETMDLLEQELRLVDVVKVVKEISMKGAK